MWPTETVTHRKFDPQKVWSTESVIHRKCDPQIVGPRESVSVWNMTQWKDKYIKCDPQKVWPTESECNFIMTYKINWTQCYAHNSIKNKHVDTLMFQVKAVLRYNVMITHYKRNVMSFGIKKKCYQNIYSLI